MKEGKEDGKWTLWYETGQKKYEITFKEGKKDGPYTMWDEQGNIIKQITLKNGKVMK